MSATGIKGFTLIEVLVVVAITGIILAVAAVNLFPGDMEIARRESGRIALGIERARDAAWFGGRQALQCHGAIGYTVEHDLQLYLKRTWALAKSWGDPAWHRDRVGAAIGI